MASRTVEPLNGLNVLSWLREVNAAESYFSTVACCLVPHVCLVRAASFSLEIAFRVQKATAKFLNNSFYATLFRRIKNLPWSTRECGPAA
jgi:hypothetical protein